MKRRSSTSPLKRFIAQFSTFAIVLNMAFLPAISAFVIFAPTAEGVLSSSSSSNSSEGQGTLLKITKETKNGAGTFNFDLKHSGSVTIPVDADSFSLTTTSPGAENGVSHEVMMELTESTGTVRVIEAILEGWELDSVYCFNMGDETPVPVTVVQNEDEDDAGFKASFPAGSSIECIFTNMYTAPPSECLEENLLTNGSFEALDGRFGLQNGQALNSLMGGSMWDIFSSLPDVTDGGGTSWYAMAGMGVEVQANTVVPAQDGNHYIELDTHGEVSNAIVSQDVTVAGGNYMLSFWHRARTETAGDNTFYITHSGAAEVILHSEDGTAPSDWTYVEVPVTLSPGLGTFSFEGAGIQNSLGAFIDNVSLTCDEGSSSSSSSSSSGAVCGNEVIEEGEQCDDGGVENGDGCSAICQFEEITSSSSSSSSVKGTGGDTGGGDALRGLTLGSSNGSHRGSRTNEMNGALGHVANANSIGSLPPGGFGGTDDFAPLNDEQLSFLCSAQRMLPANPSSVQLSAMSSIMQSYLPYSTEAIIQFLVDPFICGEISASLRPAKTVAVKEAPKVIAINSKGLPVSTNAAFNTCVESYYLGATKENLANGAMKECDQFTKVIGNGQFAWRWVDNTTEDIYFSIKKENGKTTIAVPKGYVVKPMKSTLVQN